METYSDTPSMYQQHLLPLREKETLINSADIKSFQMSKLFSSLQMGFDVFNALDLMNNKEFLEKLKFGIGDGNLQYYLYNWKCPYMEPHQVGFSDTIFRPHWCLHLRGL